MVLRTCAAPIFCFLTVFLAFSFFFPENFFFFHHLEFFSTTNFCNNFSTEPLLLLNADEHWCWVCFVFGLCFVWHFEKKKASHKKKGPRCFLYYFFVCVVSKIVRREIKTNNTIGAILRTGTTKLGLLCGTHGTK